MKYAYLLICLLATMALSAAEPRFTMKPESPRSISIGTKKLFHLVKDGKSNFDVVLPADADNSLRQVGKELCSLLGTMCSAQLAPVNQAAAGRFDIRLGYAPEALKLDRDGFAIKTGDNGVEILGAKEGHGLQFGVYDFLERFAGARFYFPGKYGTILPELKNWSLPEIAITDRPDHQHRKINWRDWGAKPLPWYEGSGAVKEELELFARRLRLSTNRLPNVHGINELQLVKRFGKTNLEFFALNEDNKRMNGTVGRHNVDRIWGQICFSSPELKAVIYEDAVAALTGKPASIRGLKYWAWTQQKPFFNLMPNDSMKLCRCPGCWKHFSSHPQVGGKDPAPSSEFLWRWYADIAGDLQKNGVPGYVTTMAYHVCRPVPKTVELPANMIVMLAQNGPWDEANPAVRNAEDALLKAWYEKLGQKLYVWNYPTKFCVNVPLIPNTSPRAVASYYKRSAPYSFGAYFEAESDCWLFGYLNYVIFSRVMWDANVDVDALLKEHCEKMFGGGAAQMLRFFDIMEKIWVEKIAANSENTPTGPKTLPPSEYKTWNSIFTAEIRKEINALFAAAAKKAGSKDAKERVLYMRKHFWTPVENAAMDYVSRSISKDQWRYYVQEVEPQPDEMTIDGKADEAVWKKIQPLFLPALNDMPTKVATTVKMFASATDLYLLYECAEPNTDNMRLTQRKHDDDRIWNGNAVEFYLNPSGDRNEYYQLMINALGNLADLKVNAAQHRFDMKWESNAEVKANIVSGKKWVVEVRIPRSSLPALKPGATGNFSRIRALKDAPAAEYFSWSVFAKSFGDVANFGRICLGADDRVNLLEDGDFRTTNHRPTPNGWFDWNSSLQRDTEVYRAAGAAIRLDGKHRNLVQRLPNLKPNTTYKFSFMVKTENIVNPGDKNQVGGFTCRIDDGAPANVRQGVRYFPNPAYVGTIPWLRQEFIFRTVPEAGQRKKPILYFSIPTGDGKAWVDCVSLEEVK